MSDIIPFVPRFEGLVPANLVVRSAKIHLDRLEVLESTAEAIINALGLNDGTIASMSDDAIAELDVAFGLS